jgi:hypothetical protein
VANRSCGVHDGGKLFGKRHRRRNPYAAALGLLPLAIGMNEAGREIEGPMAVIILGGLLTSMALNLLILPTLALRYGRFERESPLGTTLKRPSPGRWTGEPCPLGWATPHIS